MKIKCFRSKKICFIKFISFKIHKSHKRNEKVILKTFVAKKGKMSLKWLCNLTSIGSAFIVAFAKNEQDPQISRFANDPFYAFVVSQDNLAPIIC